MTYIIVSAVTLVVAAIGFTLFYKARVRQFNRVLERTFLEAYQRGQENLLQYIEEEIA